MMIRRAKSLVVLAVILTLSGSALALDKKSALDLVTAEGEVWLREGWRFAGATLRGSSVLYQYEYLDEQILEVVVQPRDPRGHSFANTANLTISYSETGPASARVENADEVFAFMKGLVAAIGAKDDGKLFEGVGEGGPEGGGGARRKNRGLWRRVDVPVLPAASHPHHLPVLHARRPVQGAGVAIAQRLE